MRLIDADYFDKVLIDAQQKCAGRNMTFKYGFLSTVRANLERCPTVDAEQIKRGKWLTCDDGWGDVHYQCSACGNEWCLNYGTPEENGMNYCPHCGAKMDGGEKDG